MVTNAFTSGKGLISAIIQKMPEIGKVQSKFIEHILILILAIKGRINLMQFGRWGKMCEQSYRNNYSKRMNFLKFNKILIKEVCFDEIILVFDPSYISKSGKQTYGIGYFYSGVSGTYKKGMEIGCISAIDVKLNTAYHLVAKQTKVIRKKEKETLIDQFEEMIISDKEHLIEVSKILAVDAYFCKNKFVNKMMSNGFEVITRTRDDANLRYIYNGCQTKGKGRPRKYSGKIDTFKIDKRIIKNVGQYENLIVYSGVVFAQNLKRKVKLVYVEIMNSKKELMTTKLLISTNPDREPMQILQYYKCRFQMEFNFRDAKQMTGLTNCQARDKVKLENHFNYSLTAINITKCIARQSVAKDQEVSISIHNIKTELLNIKMVHLIFSKYHIDPNLIKNNDILREILDFGKIAA